MLKTIEYLDMSEKNAALLRLASPHSPQRFLFLLCLIFEFLTSERKAE